MVQSLKFHFGLKKQTSFNEVLYVFPTVEERYQGDTINLKFQEVKVQFKRIKTRRSVWNIMLRCKVYSGKREYRDIRSLFL